MAYTPQSPWGRNPGSTVSDLDKPNLQPVTPLHDKQRSRLRHVEAAHTSEPVPFTRSGAKVQRFEVSTLQLDGSIFQFDHSAPVSAQLDEICGRFARGSLVKTERGETSLEDLCPGDLVETKDNGLQKLLWIGSCSQNRHISDQGSLPIRIKTGALGNLRPSQDLIVTPLFRLMLGHNSCNDLFDSAEVLAPLVNLIDGDTVVQIHSRPHNDSEDGLTFYNLMFKSHQIIQVNGIETESYHPGRYGVNVMSFEQQSHMRAIFPHLNGDLFSFGECVRPVLRGFEAEVLKVG